MENVYAVNALAPPTDLYVILYFIQLTVDKYDVGKQLHTFSYALKFKILGHESCISFCLIIISYDKQYHICSESNIITRVLFVPNITSANVIFFIFTDSLLLERTAGPQPCALWTLWSVNMSTEKICTADRIRNANGVCVCVWTWTSKNEKKYNL